MIPQNKWNNTDKATEESSYPKSPQNQSCMQVVYVKNNPKEQDWGSERVKHGREKKPSKFRDILLT